MKRIAGVAAMMIFLLVFSAFAPAVAASVNAISDEASDEFEQADETLEEEPEAPEAELGADAADDTTDEPDIASDIVAPSIRWTYPVPLSALYAPVNRLVNRDNLLEESYEPADLVKMGVKKATSAAVYMDRVAGEALEAMFEAAKKAGYTLYLKSGYRSYGTQKTTYSNRLASNNGKDDGVVAYPGSSEHQTGLSCDILNAEYAGRPRMTTDFSQTKEAQWMKEHCTEFGYILRYPDNKTDITKIIFEPWHFRYVGKEVASYVMGRELTLEEFFNEWQLAVSEFQGNGGDVDAWIAYESERKNGGPQSYVLDVYGEDGDAEVSLTF